VSHLRIEPLARAHDLERFNSGAAELDRWLARFARVADAAGTARSYVLLEDQQVIGYYALAAGPVRAGELPARHARGMPRHPIGVILLPRLAVAEERQGRGYGSLLVADAAERALAAAEVVGARAMIVHARDERAAAFYARFGFLPAPSDPLHLAALIKDLRKTFGSSSDG
jgi:GNAT superfamily N-acetyltransferase